MKKHLTPVLIFFGFPLIVVASVIIGSLATVNNTTVYGPTNAIVSSVTATPVSYTITNEGLTATTALTAAEQWSLDGTNWTTETNWNPSITNPSQQTFTPGPLTVTIYHRLAITTTNSVVVGVTEP